MVAILILVGKGLEDFSIVQQMLDTDTFGNKPQYNLADDVRLLLLLHETMYLNLESTRFGSVIQISNLLCNLECAAILLLD